MAENTYPPAQQIVTVTILLEQGAKKTVGALVDSVSDSGRVRLKLPLTQDGSDFAKGSLLNVEYNHTDAHYLLLAKIESVYTPPLTESSGRKSTIVTLETPQQINRIQRRKFFRYHLELPVLYVDFIELPAQFEAESSVRAKAFDRWHLECQTKGRKAVTCDLSGGGLSLLTNSEYALGDAIYLEIKSKDLPLQLVGLVRRCVSSQAGDGYAFSIGVEFLGLNEKQQSQIIQFIFTEQQRRQRHLFE